jgi:hypothetical protein
VGLFCKHRSYSVSFRFHYTPFLLPVSLLEMPRPPLFPNISLPSKEIFSGAKNSENIYPHGCFYGGSSPIWGRKKTAFKKSGEVQAYCVVLKLVISASAFWTFVPPAPGVKPPHNRYCVINILPKFAVESLFFPFSGMVKESDARYYPFGGVSKGSFKSCVVNKKTILRVTIAEVGAEYTEDKNFGVIKY